MNAEGDVVESFEELRRIIPNITDPASDPEQTVRDVHKAWKDAGGNVSGKPRHSDRFLDDGLKNFKTPVKSLTPKLIGKTRIKAGDAERLLRFLLARWPNPAADANSEGVDLRYEPLLPKDEINEIVGDVVEHIKGGGAVRSEDEQIAVAVRDEQFRPLPGQDAGQLITGLFAECDAYFTVATERALVTEPKTILIGFRNLLNVLKSIEDEDGKPRPIVWIIDLGRRTFQDLESRLRFVAFKDLQTRFLALREFDDRGREERWRWLSSRAVFVVQDVRHDVPLDMRGVKRPQFVAHHASFTAIAPAWAASSNFRTLYGRDLEQIDQRTFTVFFNANGWPYDGEFVTEEPQRCRFFGYASFAEDAEANAEKRARALELPWPGVNYEDAYRTIYSAAADMLEIEKPADISDIPSGTHAVAQLGYLGFRVLKLDEFMGL